ncbi:MAG: hypothetical protein P4L74_00005 [Candidatus Doudnabacteria bacterium]|nr:hypothetical protein [Candidatus Doudnabacteria bacterium]
MSEVVEWHELKRLMLNHAQIISGKGPKVVVLAERPDLLAAATLELEFRLRRLAKNLSLAAKSVLFEELAADNPGLDFSGTRRLFGL